MFKRIYAVFTARNREFFRDRGALAWNIIFPIILVIAFGTVFSTDTQSIYSVGIVQSDTNSLFSKTQYIDFIEYENQQQALFKLKQHRLDLVVDYSKQHYWLNDSSPNGYIVAKLLLHDEPEFIAKSVVGREIRYIDWVIVGILAMNMMFSSLFGVGYTIVRYRKNLVLKRLHATPLTAIEFISAQILSRLFIVLTTSLFIYLSCHFIFDFYILGSYFNLLLIALAGSICLISLGLLSACRSESEELAGGLLNLFVWPMMILGGVWFPLEGAPEFIQQLAQLLPLTHIIDAARGVMLNGETLIQIKYHLFSLIGMAIIFLSISTLLFRWHGEGR